MDLQQGDSSTSYADQNEEEMGNVESFGSEYTIPPVVVESYKNTFDREEGCELENGFLNFLGPLHEEDLKED